MFPPTIAIALNQQQGKPKYMVTIEQTKRGFIVDVQSIVNEMPPLSQEEAQRKLGQFIRNAHQNAQGMGDPVLDKAYGQAKDEEKEREQDILGRRTFQTLKEMLAFLTFVYEEDSPTEKPTPKKKK